MTALDRHGPVAFRAASVLFFLSGGTGLAYQVIWFKRFSHVWGNSSLAMAAVVASFLTGLGLGAWLVGRVSDRLSRPLAWYGAAECAIGVLAVLIPLELVVLQGAASALYPHLGGHGLLFSAVRVLLTFLVLGPPCLLMGGTLPLLLSHCTRPGMAPRESAGWLYAINTLGAATGCYLAGFHLLPGLGLFVTNLLVAALNLALGAVAIAIGRRPHAAQDPGPSRAEAAPAASAAPSPAARTLRSVYIAAALSGAAALMLEMVWARQLALVLGGSTYAFSAMLLIFLVGIGLGSLLFHLTLRKSPSHLMAPALVTGLIVVFAACGKLLLPQLTFAVGVFRDLRASQVWNATVSVGASAVLELLPAIGMGLLFPLFVDLTRRRAEDAGRAVGNVYAWNTLGSIAGATATSLLLVPWIGTLGALTLALGMYGASVLFLLPFRRTRKEVVVASCVLVATAGAMGASSLPQDPRDTNMGMYWYGFLPDRRIRQEVLFFEEGPSANVMVTRQDRDLVTLRVNGKADASDQGDMPTQLASGYFPKFLYPEARKILVIGLGSGVTAGAALLFDDTEVVCCEIEPGVYHAVDRFDHVNHRPQDSPRFTMVLDDGRSYLQGTDEKWDAIISEPSNPWIAGTSNLFTRQYYETARERLTEEGILCQWIQAYAFTKAEYALVVRTVRSVFPECVLARISSGDTLLLASRSPLRLSSDTFSRAQELVDGRPLIGSDLRAHFGTQDVRSILVRHLILGPDALAAFAASDPSSVINSDHNMRLEFDAPLRLFQSNLEILTLMHGILSHADAPWFERMEARWGLGPEHAGELFHVAGLLDPQVQLAVVERVIDLGLALDPDHAGLWTEKVLVAGPERVPLAEITDRLLELPGQEVNRLGGELFRIGWHEHSRRVFARAVQRHPQSVSAWYQLADALEALGRRQEAETARRRAEEIDPLAPAGSQGP